MMGTCQEITFGPPDMQNDYLGILKTFTVMITFSGVWVVLVSID